MSSRKNEKSKPSRNQRTPSSGNPNVRHSEPRRDQTPHNSTYKKDSRKDPGKDPKKNPTKNPKENLRRDKSLVLKASVDKNPKGFAFLIFENKKALGNVELEDAFVPPHEARNLFSGDRVEVELNLQGKPLRIRVLERRFREIVGRFEPLLGKRIRQGWVIFERKRAREEIFIPKVPPAIKPGDWVRARLQFHEKGEYLVTAEILENFGKDLLPAADIVMVAAECNLTEAHSAEAEQEAQSKTLDLTSQLLKNRRDLRKLPFVTIDGETARDFDDAVFVERNQKGYVLWVAIADVSHYVTQGSVLDDEARARGTSVYFPERAFHMLPRALSENLCSLKPNEARFALVARIEFDRNARRLNTELMEAVIESKRRATYNEIQAEWNENKKILDWHFHPHFELYRALRKMRSDRGSIDFELPEAEILVEPNGEVISIKNRSRLDAHRLIEEFMISANESATEWMMKKGWPFVYRVHDEPSAQALEKFKALAATVGVEFTFSPPTDRPFRGAGANTHVGHSRKPVPAHSPVQGKSGAKFEVVKKPKGSLLSPKVMADLVNQLEGHPAQLLLNMALLRSLKQAIYSSTHGIHFGLASPGYTHFTSPIRRYPDLVVHRLIRMVLQLNGQKLSVTKRADIEKELVEICDHCSYRERLATEAERQSIKIKQVRLMSKKLGDDFDAKIVGMVTSGMFVQINDPYVEGMVSAESMTDDIYEFNEERMAFVGRRGKKTFKIGDSLRVKAVRADVERRQIDFIGIE